MIRKIQCMTLTPSLASNGYRTPKGTEYLFHMGRPTEISDSEDAEFFLKAGNGELFKEVGIAQKVKKKVKEIVTGKKETEPKFKDNKPNPLYDWTKEKLFDLKKNEQEILIREMGGSNYRVPRFEADRVKLILKLKK